MRLNKFISDSGFCSRREADRLIESGRVFINGKRCKTGQQVNQGDSVEVDGQGITAKRQKERVYLAFNKPEGVTCTTESSVRGNIVDFIKYPEKIFPIGRLDKFSTGLIFMTNDGDIVNKILRAGNAHEKEYVVTIDRPVTDEFVRKMSNGIPILGTVTKKCKVKKLGRNSFQIILVQGLNRQIRRMCEYLGCKVQSLQRTRIMNIELGRLKMGAWRNLTPPEMEQINKMIADSSNTQEASKDENRSKTVKQSGRSSQQRSAKSANSRGSQKSSSQKRGQSSGRRQSGSAQSSKSYRNAKSNQGRRRP